MHPDWFFDGEEFAWADSAYAVNSQTIPVHKKPASLEPMNALFDKVVAGLHVRSEHCIGALKGCFQCLHGLRVHINSNNNHYEACKWISVAVILHNLIINVEGSQSAEHFQNVHGPNEEEEDDGIHQENGRIDMSNNNAKCRQLVEELWALQH
jgi:DDE superfamily endonuclease